MARLAGTQGLPPQRTVLAHAFSVPPNVAAPSPRVPNVLRPKLAQEADRDSRQEADRHKQLEGEHTMVADSKVPLER